MVTQAEAYTTLGYFHYTSSEHKPIILDLTRSKNKNLDLEQIRERNTLATIIGTRMLLLNSSMIIYQNYLMTWMFSRQAEQTWVRKLTLPSPSK